MADITDNIIINTTGDTASMATDYGNAGTGFTNSHIPISKIAWGDIDNGYRTSLTNPLPAQIAGQTGPIDVNLVGSTGATANIKIQNYGSLGVASSLEYVAVSGNTAGTQAVGISGWIQGVTNGIPVIIATTGPANGDYSTGIHLRGAMASDGAGTTLGGTFGTALGILVQGTSAGATATVAGEVFPGYGFGVPIATTAGRRLSKDTDTITVTGDVGTSRSWTTSSATDSISVFGADQTQYIRANLYNGTGGASCGFSGDALKVAVVNGGITFSVTIGSTYDLGVTNGSAGALRIQGPTGSYGDAITVRGEQAGAVDVVSTAGLSTTVSGTVTIDDDDILQELKGTTGELIGGLINIKKGTDQISAIRTDLKSGSVRTTVSSITKPENLRAGNKKVLNDATSIHKGTELLTGVTIKNLVTSDTDVYIGSSSLVSNPTMGYLLEPGESIYLEINNLNKIYCRKDGEQSATLHYIGT
tara:strand:+ start:717 stop:2141 length:1425 start_codon:yes stop_codon:yes gene_type:complete